MIRTSTRYRPFISIVSRVTKLKGTVVSEWRCWIILGILMSLVTVQSQEMGLEVFVEKNVMITVVMVPCWPPISIDQLEKGVAIINKIRSSKSAA